MTVINGNEYDHIDISNGQDTIRHYLKDVAARENVNNVVHRITDKRLFDSLISAKSESIVIDSSTLTRGVLTPGADGNIVITNRDTGAYYYVYADVNIQNVKELIVTTRVSASNTYQYYVFVTIDGKMISYPQKYNQAITEYETYNIAINEHLLTDSVRVYILCNSSNPDIVISDMVRLYVAKYNKIKDVDYDISLVDEGWKLSREALSDFVDYDVVFTVLTDTHSNGYNGTEGLYKDTYALTNKINNSPQVDFCINLGDLFTATATMLKPDAIGYLQNVIGLNDTRKVYFAIGNHDKNAKYKPDGSDSVDYSQVITNKELGKIMLNRSDVTYNTSDTRNGRSYYYFDIPNKSMRVAVLNSYSLRDSATVEGETYGFGGTAQADWLDQVVFGTTENNVLLFAHSFTHYVDGVLRVSTAMDNVIKTYGSRIIALISGHEHSDIYEESYVDSQGNVIPHYVLNSCYRNPNTIGLNRLTVNIVGVKPTTKNIRFRRIGYVNTDAANYPANDPNTWGDGANS